MERLSMSSQDIKRLKILQQRQNGLLTQQQGALLAGLSIRQFRRIEEKYHKGGVKALLHGNLGKPSGRSDPEKKKIILRLLKEKYKGFGPTLAAEMLGLDDAIEVLAITVWRYMIEEGLWPKPKKKKKYRMWREPKQYYGQMEQLDGSEHDWFEGRGPRATLIKFIDDATSRVTWLEFVESESLDGIMQAFKNYLERNGRPLSIYTDRGKVFKVNFSNQNNERITQFERMLKELDIEIIHAYSAPAKGRVERGFETDQDRLVKLLRLRNISTIKDANEFIQSYYLPMHNKKFARSAKMEGDLHRSLEGFDLYDILARKVNRIIQSDWTVQWENRIFQFERKGPRIYPKDQVQICQRLDGSIYILKGTAKLCFKEINKEMRRDLHQIPKKQYSPIKPAKDHPWRTTNSLLYR